MIRQAGTAPAITHDCKRLIFSLSCEMQERRISCRQRGEITMPTLIATHEVDDVAHWLASPKRAEVFGGVAANIRTFVHPDDANRVGLVMDVSDMAAFEALMKSEAVAEAMKYDGVRPDTLVMLVES